MRCQICDFCETTAEEPTNNHVFLYKGTEICQQCFDAMTDSLLDFGDIHEQQQQGGKK